MCCKKTQKVGKMKVKNIKTNLKKIGILIIALIILMIIIQYIESISKNIELTQLKNNINRQMMGYIIKTKSNKVIVIDGGTTEDFQNMQNKIYQLGGTVDYWFLTHAHDDHAGAFTKIIHNPDIQIKNIYVSLNDEKWYKTYEPDRAEFSKQLIEILNREDIKEKVKSPSLNEIINIDGIKIEILGIKNPEITENPGNEQSMVIKFETGKTNLLILGDTGKKSSEKLINTQKNKLKSDIVQVSHHGQDGATKELYEVINPSICLWPTPDYLWNNDNGEGENTGPWKIFETRSWMEQLKVKKHIIEKDGDITITIK